MPDMAIKTHVATDIFTYKSNLQYQIASLDLNQALTILDCLVQSELVNPAHLVTRQIMSDSKLSD